MAKTSPEKLAAALRANLARRKAGTAPAAPATAQNSSKSPQNAVPAAPAKPRPGPKPT